MTANIDPRQQKTHPSEIPHLMNMQKKLAHVHGNWSQKIATADRSITKIELRFDPKITDRSCDKQQWCAGWSLICEGSRGKAVSWQGRE